MTEQTEHDGRRPSRFVLAFKPHPRRFISEPEMLSPGELHSEIMNLDRGDAGPHLIYAQQFIGGEWVIV